MTTPAWRTDATADEVHAALESILGNTDSIFTSNDEMRNALNLWVSDDEWRERVVMDIALTPYGDGSVIMKVYEKPFRGGSDKKTDGSFSFSSLDHAPLVICKAWLWAYEVANRKAQP